MTRDEFLVQVRKIAASATGECWEWPTQSETLGYGSVRYGGKAWYAHRLSFTLHRGPIPAGLLVCHSCDNRKCVRPDHFFLGSKRDNAVDAAVKGRLDVQLATARAARTVRVVCHRGHALTPENVREYNGSRHCRECARIRLREFRARRSFTESASR